MTLPGRGLLLATLLLALGACGAAQVFVASPGDYGEYRRVRLAATLDERLAAARHYLDERPDGRYAARLRRYFEHAEPLYFKARRRSLKGLEAYLQHLPHGPHASGAAELLAAGRFELGRESLLVRSLRASGLLLGSQKQARALAAAELLWWVRALLDPAVWRQPLSGAPAALLIRYRLSAPEPRCRADDARSDRARCTKTISRRFVLLEEGEPVERELAIELELELDTSWQLERARLAGPLVLLQSREAAEARPLDPSDRSELEGANARFVAELTRALFADERVCSGAEDRLGVLRLDCEEQRLRLELRPASAGSGAEDVVTIERRGAPRVTADARDAAADGADTDDADDDDDDEPGEAGSGGGAPGGDDDPYEG